MSNPITSAIGTQRQFSKQPERPYQKQLITPSFGRGLSVGADYNAQTLVNALGLLGKGIMAESIAQDKREREQFTADDATRMLVGKTPKDLQDFDAIQALQHSNKGFDLTDNPYAVATLDRSMGHMVSIMAKESWASENDGTGAPKTIDEAVASYNKYLQENYDKYSQNVHNKYAFDAGYFEGYTKDVLQVAHAANQRINNEARSRGQNACTVKLQELMQSSYGMDNEMFSQSFGEITRELQSYCQTSDQALDIIGRSLAGLVENETTTEKLNAIKDIAFFGDRKLGDELPMFKFYKKIADNKLALDVDSLYSKAVRPDGTLNWSAIDKLLGSLPGLDNNKNGIPQVNLPVSQGDNPDLNGLTATMKGVLPSVGGLLSLMGYGDVAMVTSGYRDEAHNAEVGGATNSYHTKGDAVDIYLGDLSADETQKVEQSFKPFFGEVLFHDAGSGKHLHLANYTGGLDSKADPTETNAFAYTPDRKKKIMSLLEARDADARRVKKQQLEDLYNNTIEAVYKADSLADQLTLIRQSGLPIDKQVALEDKMMRRDKKLRNSAASANLTATDKFWLHYEKSGVWTDMEIMRQYNRAMKAPEPIDPKLEEKAMVACARMNDYWAYVYKGQTNDKPKADSTPKEQPAEQPKQPEQENIVSAKPDKTKVADNNVIQRLKQKYSQAISSGMSIDEAQYRLMLVADKYGVDYMEVLNDTGGMD